MDFSFSEMAVVGVLAVLVWGRQLPGAARKLAKTYARFRRTVSELTDEFKSHVEDEPKE